MLCQSWDFVYVDLKRWLGAGGRLDFANAVPAKGFRVYLCEMYVKCWRGASELLAEDFLYIYVRRWPGAGKRLDLCKYFACQRISCTSM